MSGRQAFAADDVVGGYQLLQPAGKGGMAEVWQARKAGGRGRVVALKVILPHLAGQERYGRMFRAEAEVSGMMSHSNIVQVFDEGEDNGISFMVMEWVEGINLVRLREALKLIKNVDVRTSMVAFTIGQLLHGLSYAHELTAHDGSPLGIVHRDISPQNVLVSTSGDVKLLDFGVAHTVIEESSGMHVKGKLRYMAPEQLTSRVKAPTLDLFGVGALLHELLDGKRFRGDFKDDRQLHAQVMRGITPVLRTTVAPELERLRQALLAADPAGRVQSARDALEMLRQYRGYRDRRVELSKVVGSLTGASRPRSAVSPGGASQASMPGPAASMPPGPAPAAAPSVPPGPAGAFPSPGPAPSVPPPAAAPAFAPQTPAPAMPGPAPVAPAMQSSAPAMQPPAGGAPPAAAAPERTVFMDDGGLPPELAQAAAMHKSQPPESTTFLPNPQAGAPAAAATGPAPERTTFLPEGAPGLSMPTGEPEEGTEFIAPPTPHGPPHGQMRPASQVRPATGVRPPSQVRPASAVHAAPSVQPPAPGMAPHAHVPVVDEHSMTRFVVQQRSPVKTVLLFVVGLLIALGGAGAAAYFILDDAEPSQSSE
ncbi:MAG: serine/threonine-protein kinase [Myxococcota bacterium]